MGRNRIKYGALAASLVARPSSTNTRQEYRDTNPFVHDKLNQRSRSVSQSAGPAGPSKQVAAGPRFGQVATGPNFGPNSLGPSAHYVGLEGTTPLPNHNPRVPWRTKSRARIIDCDSSPCIGLPRILDFYAFDYSTATKYRSNFDNIDSYVSVPIGTSSWYLNFEATHHGCQNVSGLNESTPYLGTSSLLMGNGAPTKISSIGNSILPTKKRLLHLSNVFLQECSLDADVFALWHKRLGHPSVAAVKIVLDKCQIVSNKKFFDNGLAFVACGNNLYYVSFIDIGSQFTWIYLIKRKSQADECFRQFQQMVFTQFGKNIKKFQSDWGGEFRAFTSVLSSHGILHRLSCPHTPKQNSVAERKHQHIVETGLTLLAQANLPMCYWDYASCSAFHLINRLPTLVLKGQSPYQALYGHEPTYDHLRGIALNIRVITVSHQEVRLLSLGMLSLMSVDFYPTPSSNPVQSDGSPAMCSLVQTVPVDSSTAIGSDRFTWMSDPTALSVEAVDFEPRTVEEVLAHKEWKLAVQAKFDALIANSTWEIAQLVAKGCAQAPGCDFKETFSLVVKPATIRLILPIVYGPNGEPLACRLTKALYGLQQAPHAWFDKLKQFLISNGFVLSKSNASLFVKVTTKFFVYVLVYVDDIIITGSSANEISCFVQQLHKEFSLKDMGDVHYFLGIEVNRLSNGSLHLCQCKYIQNLLDRSSLANAKSVHTLMVNSSLLSKDEGDRPVDPTEYRSLAVHLVALKRILRYLHGTITHGLGFYPSDKLSLVGYTDANWGLDFDDCRSTTGYCIYFGHAPISWCSKKQQVVSRSTVEAEYRSLAAATSDIAWLVSLLTELQVHSTDPPAVWCDNSSAVAVAANPVASGSLVVGEVPACNQVADILTKPLSISTFTRFQNLLRVLPIGEAR
ncbi:hypothetical protein CXB51_014323 [Gossypium anomalum]|uniref:Integrase catalytic domain-containing protein n=1 Tax=Gossypium anomalum TaxID=47600 RepID=A0A8J5YRE1_9ROSI|nr:hypothetical protein CXB51_014323 [Gossypium anomalum]